MAWSKVCRTFEHASVLAMSRADIQSPTTCVSVPSWLEARESATTRAVISAAKASVGSLPRKQGCVAACSLPAWKPMKTGEWPKKPITTIAQAAVEVLGWNDPSVKTSKLSGCEVPSQLGISCTHCFAAECRWGIAWKSRSSCSSAKGQSTASTSSTLHPSCNKHDRPPAFVGMALCKEMATGLGLSHVGAMQTSCASASRCSRDPPCKQREVLARGLVSPTA